MNHRFLAYTGLISRYGQIFAHSWKHRHELSKNLFIEDEAEFLPSTLALESQPVSPSARLLANVLISLVLFCIVWSYFGKFDIVVNASGKVIPSGYSKTIASVDVASVKALYVEEGQQVKTGEVLIQLDASASNADRDKAEGDRSQSILQVARSKALISAVQSGNAPVMPHIQNVSEDKWQAEKMHLDGQFHDFNAKIKRIDVDIQRFSDTLPLVTQRANDFKELSINHDVSTHAWMEKEQARIDLEWQLSDAKKQRTSLIAETIRIAYDQIADGNKAAAASNQDAIRSDEHGKLLTLKSPIDGTVQQMDVHTVGGVVSSAKPLMQIVPSDQKIEIEAFMENKDVGFVREGQSAEVKIDAYEYTKYGTITGKVTHVSRDAIKDEKKGLLYSTKITLDKSTINVDGKVLKLSAGMSANVDIKTGDRRIIEYFLSPLAQYIRESFNER